MPRVAVMESADATCSRRALTGVGSLVGELSGANRCQTFPEERCMKSGERITQLVDTYGLTGLPQCCATKEGRLRPRQAERWLMLLDAFCRYWRSGWTVRAARSARNMATNASSRWAM